MTHQHQTEVAVTPHLAFPFTLANNGSFAVVEQDTLDDVAQCVQVLLLTRNGERIELPEYGIDDLVFQTDIDATFLINEIHEWEPRADALITEHRDAFDEMVRTIRAHVTNRGES